MNIAVPAQGTALYAQVRFPQRSRLTSFCCTARSFTLYLFTYFVNAYLPGAANSHVASLRFSASDTVRAFQS
jgi:hypothetical protein